MTSSSFKNNFVIITGQDKNDKTEISLTILLWFALINVLFFIFPQIGVTRVWQGVLILFLMGRRDQHLGK